MIIKVAKHGHSFKGAAAYYLHDKAEDNDFNRAADVKPQTQERVDFTETRNLATENPETAWKVMAATSMDSENLKRQNREAEGKRSQASGDTQASSVYSFSVAWHPDEQGRISREEMTTAAEDALERLGLQDHQALFIAHNDTEHPHIHVMVNKTNPETGQTAKLFNDYKTLDKFAAEYREQRNEQHYCPERAKKWLNHEEGRDNKNRQKQTNAKLERGESATLNADDPRAKAMRKEFAAEGDALSEKAKTMKADHGKQWDRFRAKNKAEKSAIYDRYKAPMQDARDRLAQGKKSHAEIKDAFKAKLDDRIAKIKEAYRPAMSQLGKEQWKEKRRWETHDNTLQGRLVHAIGAAIVNRETNPAQSKGFVKDAARMFLNTNERRGLFEQVQKEDFTKLSKQMGAEMKVARSEIWAEQKQAQAHTREAMGAAVQDMKNLHSHRTGELESYKAAETGRFEDLKMNQATDRKTMQEQWGALKKKRAEGIRGLKAKLTEKLDQRHAHDQSLKARFEDKAEEETKTRKRNRSKERKPRNRSGGRKYTRE